MDARDRERWRLDRPLGFAVAIAAVAQEFPDAGEPVLPSREARVARTHVLQEEEPASRLEYARDLTHHAYRVDRRAEHERRDHRVERIVLERETLTWGFDQGRRTR